MDQQLKALRLLGFLFPPAKRQEVRDLPKQLERLTRTVDSFYSLLGARHWVFHQDLSIDDMAGLIDTHASDPEGGEQSLIRWYAQQGRIRDLARRLGGLPDLRAREQVITFAVDDYEAGRYYAVVQVLLSVMDGFVNDVDKARRRGLHARGPEEMDAWDSVVGHHLGLSAAHATFCRTFKARSDEPVTELHRNGIVHGMLTNYNNEIVATKAWNRLFAVADWARSLEAKQREAAKPPGPTWRELAAKLSDNAATRAALSAFEPSTLATGDAGFAEHEVYAACLDFFQSWQGRNFGAMATSATDFGKEVAPVQMRNEYQERTLDAFEIVALNHSAAAVCTVSATLTIDGTVHTPELRWVREGRDRAAAAPNQPGAWRLVWWGFPHMLRSP